MSERETYDVEFKCSGLGDRLYWFVVMLWSALAGVLLGRIGFTLRNVPGGNVQVTRRPGAGGVEKVTP